MSAESENPELETIYEKFVALGFWKNAILVVIVLALTYLLFAVAAFIRAPSEELIAAQDKRVYELFENWSKENFVTEFPKTENMLDAKIDKAFELVYENIPAFTDKHYTVRGEYSELVMAALGNLDQHIKNILFDNFDSAALKALSEIEKSFAEELREKLEEGMRDKKNEEESGLPDQFMQLAIDDALSRFELGDLAWKAGGASAGIGGVLVTKAVTTAALQKLALTSSIKGVTKLSGLGSGAAAGAVMGSIVPGFGTAIGGLLGGVVGWFAVDKIVVEVDEHFNREKFEARIGSLIDDQKAIFKAKVRKILHESLVDPKDKSPKDLLDENKSHDGNS